MRRSILYWNMYSNRYCRVGEIYDKLMATEVLQRVGLQPKKRYCKGGMLINYLHVNYAHFRSLHYVITVEKASRLWSTVERRHESQFFSSGIPPSWWVIDSKHPLHSTQWHWIRNYCCIRKFWSKWKKWIFIPNGHQILKSKSP